MRSAYHREGAFEPQIVKKRQRRLAGVDEMVLSLSAKGLTHGEISAHLAEVSKQTISTITDSVMEGMAEWQARPLDRVCPVVFIDCVNVEIRDGQVATIDVSLLGLRRALRRMRQVLMRAMVLSTGQRRRGAWRARFQRVVQRLRPVPVGSGDITAR